jgi:hypothetical protein
MNNFRYQIDETELRRALDLFWPNVGELRCLKATVAGEWKKGIYSGFFDRDHFDDLVAAVHRVQSADGIYFTPHEVKPELRGRSYNKACMAEERSCATDKDIVLRKWLLVDVDAVRPVAGISATDEEKEAAYAVVVDVDAYLWELGFPPGYMSDSGNGYHLMIPAILPIDDGGYIKDLLNKLHQKCSTSRASVDTSVYNPARIWKLPGTPACKGDHAPEIGSPWRMAKIITICQGMPHDA